MQEIIYADVVEKTKDYIPKIQEMITLLNKANTEVYQNIKIIKKQMRKYNS